MLTSHEITTPDGRVYRADASLFVVAKAYGADYGYHCDAGGWIRNSSTDASICQGWANFGYRMARWNPAGTPLIRRNDGSHADPEHPEGTVFLWYFWSKPLTLEQSDKMVENGSGVTINRKPGR